MFIICLPPVYLLQDQSSVSMSFSLLLVGLSLGVSKVFSKYICHRSASSFLLHDQASLSESLSLSSVAMSLGIPPVQSFDRFDALSIDRVILYKFSIVL